MQEDKQGEHPVLSCYCPTVLCAASCSCTQRGSPGHTTRDVPFIPAQSPTEAAPLLHSGLKHLVQIWWSAEQVWWCSRGRRSWWSDITHMSKVPTSLMSTPHLVIPSLSWSAQLWTHSVVSSEVCFKGNSSLL